MSDTETPCLHCAILSAIGNHVAKEGTPREAILLALARVAADMLMTADEDQRQAVMDRFMVFLMAELVHCEIEAEEAEEEGGRDAEEDQFTAEGLDDATIEHLRNLFNAKPGTSH